MDSFQTVCLGIQQYWVKYNLYMPAAESSARKELGDVCRVRLDHNQISSHVMSSIFFVGEIGCYSADHHGVITVDDDDGHDGHDADDEADIVSESDDDSEDDAGMEASTGASPHSPLLQPSPAYRVTVSATGETKLERVFSPTVPASEEWGPHDALHRSSGVLEQYLNARGEEVWGFPEA